VNWSRISQGLRACRALTHSAMSEMPRLQRRDPEDILQTRLRHELLTAATGRYASCRRLFSTGRFSSCGLEAWRMAWVSLAAWLRALAVRSAASTTSRMASASSARPGRATMARSSAPGLERCRAYRQTHLGFAAMAMPFTFMRWSAPWRDDDDLSRPAVGERDCPHWGP